MLKEFSHPGNQNLCTLALTLVPSYKTAFMTTHDHLVTFETHGEMPTGHHRKCYC